jgi:hypothetical protein
LEKASSFFVSNPCAGGLGDPKPESNKNLCPELTKKGKKWLVDGNVLCRFFIVLERHKTTSLNVKPNEIKQLGPLI